MSANSNPSTLPEAHIDDDFGDDLLDDVLQDMVDDRPKPQVLSQAPSAAQAAGATQDQSELDEDEFVRQLTHGMEQLMNGSQDTTELASAMKEVMATFGGTEEATSPAKSPPREFSKEHSSPSSFQDRIKQTMSKLHNSSQQAQTEMNRSDLGDQDMEGLMADMMKQMEGLADSGEFESVLNGMMESLLSKDILNEPIRELALKYPEYMEKNKHTLDPQEYDKYAKQLAAMREIIKIYDAGTDSEDEGKRIVALMTEIQELGQPPAELVKDLAPGMEIDQATGQVKVSDDQKPPECNQM